MENVLITKNLSKHYKHTKALDGLNMHIPKGSIYGLAGRNGAGKTTLIRMICGMQKPTSGSFVLYGISSKDRKISKARRRMGAVVETPSIFMDMNARDNLHQQFLILGIPSFDGIDDLLKLVGLEHAGNKKAKNFSLGMKQRLGIAMALAGDPDFIVLDEPANGLDPQGIVELRELLLKLNRERQITILISSHILDELHRLADHFGIMDKGRMVKEISAEQLEQACRKCTRIQVSNLQALLPVLDYSHIPYEVISEDTVDAFAKIKISSLAAAGQKAGFEIQSLWDRQESLESFYISLVGGEE